MILPKWNRVERARRCTISYRDPDYVKYYDLDSSDFEYLVTKLQQGLRLTDEERDRYGVYILTICLIVQENPKFKMKSVREREEMIEQQYYELLLGISNFDPKKGKIYSYAYRIGYTAACHYYTDKIKDKKKRDKIEQHCREELEDYMREFTTHKGERH